MTISPNSVRSTPRYRFVSRIASGGMGVVYLAIQRGSGGFQRPVAIKRAHPFLLEDPAFRKEIIGEARNASVVRHANVVSVDDVEEMSGELLLVMPYVEGTSLAHLTESSGPVETSVAVRIVIDVCEGLHAIHTATSGDGLSLGLVHRDVSPQNILVGADGVGRITDFGISKGDRELRQTRRNVRRGKFGYMAPEYLLASEFSAQSDIFALGVVLWEALTGHDISSLGEPVECTRMTIEGRTPPASSINPAVPFALDAVILQCLSPNPALRYASARCLAVALQAAVRPSDRAEVADLVNEIAGETIELHRQAIRAACSAVGTNDSMMVPSAGCEIRDAGVETSFEVSEANILDTKAVTFQVRESAIFRMAARGEADEGAIDVSFDSEVLPLIPLTGTQAKTSRLHRRFSGSMAPRGPVTLLPRGPLTAAGR